MKLAILSDLHLGDDHCSLVSIRGAGGATLVEARFNQLCEVLRQQSDGSYDYLVLLGDVLDFSIASYTNAYAAGRVFFQALARQRLFGDVIYLPGNHDYSLWQSVQHDLNVVSHVAAGRPPSNKSTISGILDARPNAADMLTLVGIRPRQSSPRRYGGLFLDTMLETTASGGAGSELARPRFAVAFPNLYLIEADETVTLLTHGQFFEPYWTFLLDLALATFGSDLRLDGGTAPSIADIVAINSGTSQMTSAGLGQSGTLGRLISRIQDDVEAGRVEELGGYVHHMVQHFAGLANADWLNLLVRQARPLIQHQIDRGFSGGMESLVKGRTRRVVESAAGSRLMNVYLWACTHECTEVIPSVDPAAPAPTPGRLSRLIYGHTHDAHGFDNPDRILLSGRPELEIVNTGGWLKGVRALVVTYDTERDAPWRSVEL